MTGELGEDVQQRARRFEALDAAFQGYVTAKDWPAAVEALQDGNRAAFRLRWELTSKGPVACADHHDREVLERFRRGDFPILQAIHDLGLAEPEDEPPAEACDYYPDSHLAALLNPEDPEYWKPIVRRLLLSGVVVTAHALPPWLRQRMETVRRCFALALYDAAWVFLRAVIEAASYDWHRSHLGPGATTGVRAIIERQPLGQWLGEVLSAAAIPTTRGREIWGVVNRANEIIHAKGPAAGTDEAATLEAIEAVADYIERLFA